MSDKKIVKFITVGDPIHFMTRKDFNSLELFEAYCDGLEDGTICNYDIYDSLLEFQDAIKKYGISHIQPKEIEEFISENKKSK